MESKAIMMFCVKFSNQFSSGKLQLFTVIRGKNPQWSWIWQRVGQVINRKQSMVHRKEYYWWNEKKQSKKRHRRVGQHELLHLPTGRGKWNGKILEIQNNLIKSANIRANAIEWSGPIGVATKVWCFSESGMIFTRRRIVSMSNLVLFKFHF